MSKFIEVKPEEFNGNPFKLIGRDGMLITAARDGKVNTMTAGWGGFGVMWGRNVAYAVIRPQRYTKEFVDSSDTFSLTFFGSDKKEMLNYLGTTSGRDEDKIKKSNLTVIYDDATPYFEEATVAVLCKKLFTQDYKPESFIEKGIIDRWYPASDFHTLYIAEIIKIFVKE
ncbi:MAG: flavin reductase [Candidatus Alkaliphilus sp. MAG34]|nr:flavin reductase family protein [Clostridiales bacterium]